MHGRPGFNRRLTLPLLLFVLLAVAGRAPAATFVVQAGCDPQVEECDCSEIQPCIDMAAPGDTVLVLAGTYTAQETRTIGVGGGMVDFVANVFMRDGIHLLGETAPPSTPFTLAPGAIIDAGGTGIGILADQVGAGTLLDNLLIRNGNAGDPGWNSVGGGMLCLGSDLTIRHCSFEMNLAIGQGGGLACEENSSPLVESNLFSANQASVDGGALYCYHGTTEVADNVFLTNEAPDGAAIRYLDGGSIHGNIFEGNRGSALQADIGVRDASGNGTQVVVENNLFYDNTSAIFLGSNASTIIRGNTMIRGATGIDGNLSADAVQIANNLIVSETVSGISWSGVLPTLSCNDVWQNGTNYLGLTDPTGTDDNISADPLHCDPQSNNFFLAENSPCTAANSGCALQIGARQSLCPPSAIEATTWGAIKASYQE